MDTPEFFTRTGWPEGVDCQRPSTGFEIEEAPEYMESLQLVPSFPSPSTRTPHTPQLGPLLSGLPCLQYLLCPGGRGQMGWSGVSFCSGSHPAGGSSSRDIIRIGNVQVCALYPLELDLCWPPSPKQHDPRPKDICRSSLHPLSHGFIITALLTASL